ncbi:MAG TPA: xanthine dehydrogenase family protein, partial [Pseudomonadales bacterium]|nr:xanthine dehydrogenase family protein [Pseudomonadales bacterium]
ALKDKTDFKVIGSSRKNLVGPSIVQGDGLFGIDIRQEGMLRATVLHAPAFGMTLDTFDANDAKAMPGIKDIFAIKMYPDDYIRGFSDVAAFREVIAIVGDSTWQVLKAKKAVKATWKQQPAYRYKAKDFGGNINEVKVPSQLENSVDHEAAMQALIDGDMTQKRRDGNPENAFAKAAKVIERTYSAPFLAHNPLEPLNFYADVRSDSAKLMGPHQGSILIHQSVAAHLGMDPNQVEMIMTRMGGGFGRRLYLHFATEVALISQHVKRPVHLIYDREEDMTVGVYRPAYRIKMRAALDANNQLVAYHVRSAGVPEACSFPNRFPAGAVENFLWEEGVVASNITVGAFRAPHSNFMATAEQCFLDEI